MVCGVTYEEALHAIWPRRLRLSRSTRTIELVQALQRLGYKPPVQRLQPYRVTKLPRGRCIIKTDVRPGGWHWCAAEFGDAILIHDPWDVARVHIPVVSYLPIGLRG